MSTPAKSRLRDQVAHEVINRNMTCREVLRQLGAVRASIQSTTRYFLESVVSECENPGNQMGLTQKEITSELLEMITKG